MDKRPSNFRTGTLCAMRWVLMCALAAGLGGVGAAQAHRSSSRRPAPPQDLPDRINSLMLQLNGVPLNEAGNIPAQVESLVIPSLTSWVSQNAAVNSRGGYPLDVRVRQQLEHDFSKLHYPLFGHPLVFVRPWNGGKLIGAGFTLGWSDFDRVNLVALFESKGGKTWRVALTHFVPYTDLHYSFIAPGPHGSFRFLAYGYRLGKSQPRLSVVLYSLNGQKLTRLWARQDLYDGRMEVTPDTVTFRYLIENDYIQAVEQGQLPSWHEALYNVAPQGLTLVTERLLPYRSAP